MLKICELLFPADRSEDNAELQPLSAVCLSPAGRKLHQCSTFPSCSPSSLPAGPPFLQHFLFPQPPPSAALSFPAAPPSPQELSRSTFPSCRSSPAALSIPAAPPSLQELSRSTDFSTTAAVYLYTVDLPAVVRMVLQWSAWCCRGRQARGADIERGGVLLWRARSRPILEVRGREEGPGLGVVLLGASCEQREPRRTPHGQPQHDASGCVAPFQKRPPFHPREGEAKLQLLLRVPIPDLSDRALSFNFHSFRERFAIECSREWGERERRQRGGERKREREN